MFLAGNSTSHILTWMRQAGDNRPSWLFATGLFVVGLSVFTAYGPKRVQ